MGLLLAEPLWVIGLECWLHTVNSLECCWIGERFKYYMHERVYWLQSKSTSNNTNLPRLSSPANWSMYYTIETQWLHAQSLTGHGGMKKRNIILRSLSSRLRPLDMQDEIVISMSVEPLDGLFSILPAIESCGIQTKGLSRTAWIVKCMPPLLSVMLRASKYWMGKQQAERIRDSCKFNVK